MRSGRRGAVLLLAGAALLCAGADARAEIYRWTDSAGRVHYSDRKPADADARTVAVDERQPAPPPVSPVPGRPAAPTPVAQAKRAQPEVTMYMSPTCGYCIKAARLFQSRGIAWRNVDITASAQAKAEFDALGGHGTPLIYIAGQRFNGFSASKLQNELARHGW